VGTIVDTSVLIQREREGLPAVAGFGEDTAIAAITASELLHGVHRADVASRARREARVESVLRGLPVIPFDLAVARVHARLWAELASAGTMIGAHDLEVAATAMFLGWDVATHNAREFRRVAGLTVRDIH
jgi:tRNA(fMet)-specific endonuclease VapC